MSIKQFPCQTVKLADYAVHKFRPLSGHGFTHNKVCIAHVIHMYFGRRNGVGDSRNRNLLPSRQGKRARFGNLANELSGDREGGGRVERKHGGTEEESWFPSGVGLDRIDLVDLGVSAYPRVMFFLKRLDLFF